MTIYGTPIRGSDFGRLPGQGRQPAWIAAWPLFDLLIGRGTPDCYIKLRNRGWVISKRGGEHGTTLAGLSYPRPSICPEGM